jgi:hypothetical protein
MARWVLEILGFRVLSLVVEPDPEVEETEEEEEEGTARLSTSDHSFGFAADPVFRDYWEDEE